MCGIVGYIGEDEAKDKIMRALSALSYRGYDSSGIAIASGGLVSVVKAAGGLCALEAKVLGNPLLSGTTGIGHTRWATCGKATEVNAHPHTNEVGTIACVHNGIIENYKELKARYPGRYYSDTDTEVLPHIVEHYYNAGLQRALEHLLIETKGQLAAAFLTATELWAVKRGAPLVLGRGRGMYLSSDPVALSSFVHDVCYLLDGDIVHLTKQGAAIYHDGEEVERAWERIEYHEADTVLGGYAHFMIKEIHEAPRAVSQTVLPYLKTADGRVRITLPPLTAAVTLTGSGTAFNAALVGARLLGGRAVEASEFCADALVGKGETVVAISQSGGTYDTIQAVKRAHAFGAATLAITNGAHSEITRVADSVVYTKAGPEIAVAATKTYLAQVAALALLKGGGDLASLLYKASASLEEVLKVEGQVQRLAYCHYNKSKVFFIGRGVDALVARECALKLKEVSYIHSEAFAAGELKHGPIALVDDDTLLVALATECAVKEKMRTNILETCVRGAQAVVVTDTPELFAEWECIKVPNLGVLSPLATALVGQLFAYYIAVNRNLDPDKPRNLAKCVTVE